MNLLKIIFIGLIAVPVVGTILLQFFSSVLVFGVAHNISSEIDRIEQRGKADSAFAADLEITGTKAGNDDKAGYVALASFEKLDDYRSVNASFYVRLKDMLDAGEIVPEKELVSAFVTARTSRFADAECELLKKSLAAECTVYNSAATATNNGLVRISVGLNFVQKSDFGTIKAKDRAAYVEIEERLTGSTPDTVSFSGGAIFRSSIYEQAVKLCDKIRTFEGNCAIFKVLITTALSEQSGSAQNMRATAILSTIEAL